MATGIFNTPLWRALLPLSFSLVVFGLNGAIYTTLATAQLGRHVYSAINGVDTVVSLITFTTSGIVGELSQPSRFGRKAMLMYVSVADTIPIALLHLTKDYTLFLKVRFVMAFVGISRATEGLSMHPIIVSWITDWATEEQKLSMYSTLLGGIFVFYAIGPLISGTLLHAGAVTTDALLFATLIIKALQPLFVFFLFPSDLETRQLAKQPERQIVSEEDGQPASLHKVQWKAWRYLLKEHFEVVVVSLLLTIVGKAFQKNFPIYLAKELHLETHQVFYLIGTGCVLAIVGQLAVVPRVRLRCRPSPSTLLSASVSAQLVHLGVLAAAESATLMYVTGFLPAIILMADPVVQSAVASSGDHGGLSQGVKQGALSGMRIAASSIGPLSYSLVAMSPSCGARGAWVAQGLLLLPALGLLLRRVRRDGRQHTCSDHSWVQGYAT